MPATWGKAAENTRPILEARLQIHCAWFGGPAVAAEGSEIGQEFLGRQPVCRLRHEVGDGLWRLLHHRHAEENSGIEIRADGGEHGAQGLQHVVAAMRGMGQRDGLADDMLARDKPVDGILQAAGERSDVFGAGDDNTIGSRDLVLEGPNDLRRRITLAIGREDREIADTGEDFDCDGRRRKVGQRAQKRGVGRLGAGAAGDGEEFHVGRLAGVGRVWKDVPSGYASMPLQLIQSGKAILPPTFVLMWVGE